MKKIVQTFLVTLLLHAGAGAQTLEQSFLNPQDEYKPWVYWFWINGNMKRDGITKDLEAMKRVGINGVLWMEVSGPFWAPQGPVDAGTKAWDDTMQWAISELDRLGMDMDMTIDFGYGTGGPHITPDNSMQQLVRSETTVTGGRELDLRLERSVVDYKPKLAEVWLRPGKELDPNVMKGLEEIDSYRDIAVFAVKVKGDALSRLSDKQLHKYDGTGRYTVSAKLPELSTLEAVPHSDIVFLTDKMGPDGELKWDAPAGTWQIIRLGHASNFKMTRPSPNAAVGLECDRLNPKGVEAHFEHHLKPILEQAGDKAGRTLQYIHVDSWEAHGQNWTDGYAEAFKEKRGYDITPWLPVLAGIMVESEEMTTRFLWDMRLTASEMILENYVDRLKELIKPYGVAFSSEPYGDMNIDSLTYGGRAELPICEFWTPQIYDSIREKKGTDALKVFMKPIRQKAKVNKTSKALASVANTYGRKRLGAESFTGAHAWGNHPWLIKALGDGQFAQGINHYIYHLSAHQAYDNMVPGLTHRKWGMHFQRHQTWWEYSRPYFEYVARCQTLLQQGRTVVDFAVLPREGSPVRLGDYAFNVPDGYDYDVCSSEIVRQMEYDDGLIRLPSGVVYRYLILPDDGLLTLATARKVDELRRAGASVYQFRKTSGSPSLTGYPGSNEAVKKLARDWPVAGNNDWKRILSKEGLPPDFEGEGLNWIHKRTGDTDIYFVANPEHEAVERSCRFRVAGKTAELWDPETGEIIALGDTQSDGRQTTIDLSFDSARSWFVVFKNKASASALAENPFPAWESLGEINGPWKLSFDPQWGSDRTLTLDALDSWSDHTNPLVKYYSGTGTYRTTFEAPVSLPKGADSLYLDLGEVAVMARVTLNGKDCGSVWKPPYRVDITHAIQKGRNELKVEVANTWANRLIGDEQLPLDSEWKNWEILLEWPDWFKEGRARPSGRYTLTSARHYTKDDPLLPAGLLGPVRLVIPR